MTRRHLQLLESLAVTVITLALLAGVPWLLTTQVGPPLPARWPNLDMLRSLSTTGVSDTVAITTLAVIVWLAWAQLSLALLIELAAALRRRPAIRLPLLPGAQPFAARLVAATLLLVTALQPRPALATAPLEVAVTTTVPDTVEHRPAAAEMSAVARPAATATVTVGERDSWWALAERHLGDGLRWREIRTLNLDRTLADGITIRNDTDQLEAGWQLLVPATEPTVDPSPEPAQPTSARWQVARGDHFWSIARHTLAAAWERTPTDAEIAPYWRNLVAANHDRLAPPGDADLIHPGQHFDLPAIPADLHATPDPPTAPNDDNPARTTPSPVVPDRLEPPPTPDDLADADASSQAPSRTTGTPDRFPEMERPPAEQTPKLAEDFPEDAEPDPADSAPSDADADEIDSDTTTALGVPVGAKPGAAAAALAAAGIVALVHRRRRQRLHQRLPALRLPTPADPAAAHLAMLERVTPPDDVLADLETLLTSVPLELAPPLVLIHDSGPVSIILEHTDPGPEPVAPWRHDHRSGEPARWTARLGDHGPRRSIGMPLLVTLGRTATTTVLANLGAIGSLSVDGDPDEVRTRLRAMTFEVATSRTSGPLEVSVHGDELTSDLDQVRTIDDPADEVAAAVTDAHAGIIDDDRVPRLVVCHHTDPDVTLPAAVAGYCAIVRPGTPTPRGWTLSVDGDQGRLHTPDGISQSLTLPELQPDVIAAELANLSPTASPPPGSSHTDQVEQLLTDAASTEPASPRQPRQPWCEIALLGPMLATRDGQPIEGLTPITRQLLAYLATRPDAVTLERLDDAIWPGHTPSAGGQRARTALARLRRCLGDDPDGNPLLPRRAQRDDRIRLSPMVGTDLDRAFHHLATARTLNGDQQLDELLAAIGLVRGEPFEDLAASWTIDIQQRAIAQLQDAAVAAAERLREAGRYADAEQAIGRGLTLCDPAEPLYIEWARVEHARGRTDRIPPLWRRLRQRYADDADEIAGVMTTPTIETELAFTALAQMGPSETPNRP